MMAERRCWWCGKRAEVDTEAQVSNGLERDDSTMDGSESWICDEDNQEKCVERAVVARAASTRSHGRRKVADRTGRAGNQGS